MNVLFCGVCDPRIHKLYTVFFCRAGMPIRPPELNTGLISRYGLVLFCVLLAVTAGIAPVVAASEYDIQIDDSTDIPPRTIEDPPVLVGDSYEIDAFAVRDRGEELTLDITIPDDAESSVGDTEVELYNSDQNLVDAVATDSDGEAAFSGDQMDLEPGTYSLALVDEITEAIHPVVVSGYDISVENPTDVEEDNEITVEGTVTPTEADGDPEEVNVVIWNDDDDKRVELTKDDDETYTEDVSLSGLEPGEYNIYVTAHGEDEFRGEKEVMGLGEGEDITIEESDDESPNDENEETENNGGGGAGDTEGGATGGATGGGGMSPIASESKSITDEAPSESGMTVQFSQGAVNSVTFSEGAEGGSIDVEEYDGTPPGAPDTGDRPVMEGVTITPSEEHRDTTATIQITVDQTEVLRADATAEDLAVLKATDTGYQTLDTAVVDDNGDVVLEAETPGFSTFIVSTNEGDIESTDDSDSSSDSDSNTGSEGTATETATPGDDVVEPSDPNTDSETMEPDEQPGFALGTAIVALSLAMLIARRRAHR